MNAPSRKNAAWPIEICPVKPTRIFSPSAAIAKIPIWIEMESQYALNSCGAKQSRMTPAIAVLRLVLVGKIVVSAA